MAMNRSERWVLADDIVQAMRAAYEAEGVDGDFDDATRHYREDASEEEIRADHAKWCKA